MNMHILEWTEGRVELLCSLHATKASYREIAALMGVSRNAIVGKVHRLGLPERVYMVSLEEREARRLISERRRQDRRLKQASDRRKVSRGERIHDAWKPTKDDLADRALHVNFMQLEPHHCRFAYGDEPSSFTFCGHHKIGGSSYCADHRLLCSVVS